MKSIITSVVTVVVFALSASVAYVYAYEKSEVKNLYEEKKSFQEDLKVSRLTAEKQWAEVLMYSGALALLRGEHKATTTTIEALRTKVRNVERKIAAETGEGFTLTDE